MSSRLFHPIPAGTKVHVHRIVLVQRPFSEGKARVIAPIPGEPGVYRVRFDGERVDQVRFIFGGAFQSHSEACLSELHAQWLVSFRNAQHLQVLLRSDERGC